MKMTYYHENGKLCWYYCISMPFGFEKASCDEQQHYINAQKRLNIKLLFKN